MTLPQLSGQQYKANLQKLLQVIFTCMRGWAIFTQQPHQSLNDLIFNLATLMKLALMKAQAQQLHLHQNIESFEAGGANLAVAMLGQA